MKIKLLITCLFCMLLIILGTGCVDSLYTQVFESPGEIQFVEKPEPTQAPKYTPEPQEPQESKEMMWLLYFLKVDRTNNMVANLDPQRGVDYQSCTGYSRDLAKNAKEYGIDMGAISLRDTMKVGMGTRYYHAMNYCIVDGKFIIIEPQTDEVFTLETLKKSDNSVYKYISIYQDAQMMTNFGKGKQTIDINVYGEHNESEIIRKFPPISN